MAGKPASKPRKRELVPGKLRKYKPEFCQRAMDACLLGATNPELAALFGVTSRAVDFWIAEKPEFAQAVRQGRKDADGHVARALYLKATGQWTQPAVKIATKIKVIAVPDGNGGVETHEVKSEYIVPYVEHFPPDTVAAIFWLKNRDPARWRDKHEVQATQDVRHSGRIEHVLSEEARRWINEDLEEMGLPLIEAPRKSNGKGNGKGKAGEH